MLRIIIAALALTVATAGTAQAQTVAPNPANCTDVRRAGLNMLSCPDGKSYKSTRIDGEVVLVEVRPMTVEEANAKRDEAEQKKFARRYRPRSGGTFRYSFGGYRYSGPIEAECWLNNSTIRAYFDARCRAERRRHAQMKRTGFYLSPICFGENKERYADECRRQRNGTYGRR